MNMAKSSFCIFTLAVLFSGSFAGGDLICLLKVLLDISPDHFFTSPLGACQNIEMKFNKARQGIKDCGQYQIDTSELQDLHNEFCDINSNYRKKFNRQEVCLSRNLLNAGPCLTHMQQSLTPEKIYSQTPNEICHSISVEMSTCLRDRIGGPCGSEGLEVYGRITKASELIFKGSCLSGFGNVDFKYGTVEPEHSIVEATITEGYTDSAAVHSATVTEGYKNSAAVHSAFLWCILLGLLLTVKWW